MSARRPPLWKSCGNFLGVPLADFTSDVEERFLRSGVLSVGGASSDLSNITASFTITYFSFALFNLGTFAEIQQ